MRKGICLLLCAALVCGFAAALADRTVPLPNSRYAIGVPDWMRHRVPDDPEAGMEAYLSEMLEIDYSSFPRASFIGPGKAGSLREVAESTAASGREAELRSVRGIEMICFRTRDPGDGAPCIGYLFEDGDWLVEIDFWYATQEAADLTAEIISSIHETEP